MIWTIPLYNRDLNKVEEPGNILWELCHPNEQLLLRIQADWSKEVFFHNWLRLIVMETWSINSGTLFLRLFFDFEKIYIYLTLKEKLIESLFVNYTPVASPEIFQDCAEKTVWM